MKKYFNNRLAIIATAGSALLFAACSDGEEVFDEIRANEERGAVLRTFQTISSQVLFDSNTNELVAGEEFAVVIQEQDQQNGDLLSSVEVYVGFQDETDGATDNDKAEVLLETLPASAFAKDEFGLPRTEYRVSSFTMRDPLGLADADIFGGDNFTIRFELILTDGRRFTNTNNSGTITGSFFASPFLYDVVVACAPSMPTAGTWTVSTTDTFGDGWNGGSLQVVLDGGAPIEIANVDDGTRPFAESVQEFTFEVPAGTATISIKYVSGDFDEEVKWSITSANTNVVSDLDEPIAGSELLDYCPNNL